MYQLVDSQYELHLEFVEHLYCPLDQLFLNQYLVSRVHHLTLRLVFPLTSNLPFKYLFSTVILYHMIPLSSFNMNYLILVKNKTASQCSLIKNLFQHKNNLQKLAFTLTFRRLFPWIAIVSLLLIFVNLFYRCIIYICILISFNTCLTCKGCNKHSD